MVTERSVKTLLTTYLSCFFQQLKAVFYSFIFYLNNHFTQLIHLLWFSLIFFIDFFFFFFTIVFCLLNWLFYPPFIDQSQSFDFDSLWYHLLCVENVFSCKKLSICMILCAFFFSFFLSLFFSHKIIVTFCVCMVCLKELVMHMGSAYSMTVSC